ncbi:hypothetical protein C6A85_000000102235 [Mycobacterium sp. ITM-2017-0098]|nr:hypothetical protein C6A85_000000102235 [Mycobacterium sp. ITM-2017-0098]
MMDAAAKPVVVYVDGPESSIAAALWGMNEGIARGTRVRLLAVIDPRRAGNDEAACHALLSAATALAATGGNVEIQCATARGEVAAVLLDESRRAAMLCLASRSMTALVATIASSPVVVVPQHHSDANEPDRWVVAVMERGPSAGSVLQTAIFEARLRHAAVMALTPAGRDPEEYFAEIGEPLECGGAGVEIWAVPQPGDVLAMLLQSPDLEHLVVAAADNHSIIGTFTDAAARTAPPAHFSLLVVPNETLAPPSRQGLEAPPRVLSALREAATRRGQRRSDDGIDGRKPMHSMQLGGGWWRPPNTAPLLENS